MICSSAYQELSGLVIRKPAHIRDFYSTGLVRMEADEALVAKLMQIFGYVFLSCPDDVRQLGMRDLYNLCLSLIHSQSRKSVSETCLTRAQ